MPFEYGFTEWLRRVDQELLNRVGVATSDLADCTYRDWFEDELSPVEAARRVLVNDGLADPKMIQEAFSDV